MKKLLTTILIIFSLSGYTQVKTGDYVYLVRIEIMNMGNIIKPPYIADADLVNKLIKRHFGLDFKIEKVTGVNNDWFKLKSKRVVFQCKLKIVVIKNGKIKLKKLKR